ncbi:MAG: hypothetical protein QW171_02470 [Candidatus Bilamarchaeaceae archaeon]
MVIMEEELIKKFARCVARVLDINEAERIAEDYEMKGFKTYIIKRKQGSVALYEIWVEEKPRIFEG